jgi:ribosome biogenesis protein Nip4
LVLVIYALSKKTVTSFTLELISFSRFVCENVEIEQKKIMTAIIFFIALNILAKINNNIL